MTKIFVIADTHNKLLPIVESLAKGADEIWHLGDVCAERILDELRAIGPPITLVRGNCDSNYEWPLVIDVARGGLRFRRPAAMVGAARQAWPTARPLPMPRGTRGPGRTDRPGIAHNRDAGK